MKLMANFEMVCTLKPMKETDSFKPYEVRTFDSGWQNVTYKFNAISGTNRFVLQIAGGKWENDAKNKILTFSRATEGKKSERMEVKWEDRNNKDIIDRVAGFKVFTCNLLTYDERKALEDEGEADEAAKKNHQFIEATDYATLVKRVLDSNKYADVKFKVTGTVDYQYSAKTGMFYRTYTVNKIYKVANDTPFKSELSINTFYTADSIDAETYDETKKYMFNCYTDYYFNSIKGNRFVPVTLVINGNGDETAEKRAEAFKKKLTAFDDDATVRKMALVCDMIDGAETQAITYADLDDETKENIDLGLISEEDAIKALGGSMMGNRITEYRVKSLGRASAKGSEATVYNVDDLKKLPVLEEKAKEDDDFDLFDDSDDDDI